MTDEITIEEAAELAGVSTRTIRRWIDSGRLPSRVETFVVTHEHDRHMVQPSDLERVTPGKPRVARRAAEGAS